MAARLLLFGFLILFCAPLAWSATPVALIYNGTGSCPKACAISVAIAAKEAGLTPRFVSESEIDEDSTSEDVTALFDHAKVWIQPGGYAKDAYLAMSAPLKKAITDFVFSGGGYVGFCAGAFMATETIGTTGVDGLGLIRGRTATYLAHPAREGLKFSMENVRWNNHELKIYFEGGPFFYDLDSSVDVVATYQDGLSPAAVRSSFGLGRVFLSGPHPEAPDWWWSKEGILEEEASNLPLAVKMIQWASGLEKNILLAPAMHTRRPHLVLENSKSRIVPLAKW